MVLFLAGQVINAGEINDSHVDYTDGVYSLTFDVVIDADLQTVRSIITDYADIAELSDLFIHSEILETADDTGLRRLLVARACMLFFCRDMRVVEEIEEHTGDEIITTIIPGESDFKSGTTHWRLSEHAPGKTRIEFHGDEEPDFWVPPFLGPVLVKRRLLKDAHVIINNIEARTAGEPVY